METNVIYNIDCINGISHYIPDNSIDLVVTSPPYNKGRYKQIGKYWDGSDIQYDSIDDNVPEDEYKNNQIFLIKELLRVIKPSGSVFYNVKALRKDNKIIFPEYIFKFDIRQIIIWNRNGSPQINPVTFLSTTEYIIWFTKIKKTPKFFRSKAFQRGEVWDINQEMHNNHPAPFPTEIPLNCILATTEENDVVLDPYMGSGTTAIASIQTDRKYIGFEISKKYCKMIKQRIEKEKEQLTLF